MIDYFDDLEKEITEGLNKELISMGFDRLNYHIGLRKATYYLIGGFTGSGKCLAKGTKILMFNGEYKKVEDIIPGDILMSANSNPTIVKSICKGQEEMFKITQNRGKEYVVNKSHILSLKPSGKVLKKKYGEILNIKIEDYLKIPDYEKTRLYGYKTGVEFEELETTIEPYFLGLWLGDGDRRSQRVTNTDKEVINYLKDYAKRLDHKLTKIGISYNICKDKGKKIHMLDENKKFIKSFNTMSEASSIINRAVTNISQAIKKNIKCAKYYWQYEKDTLFKNELQNLNVIKNKHIPFNYSRNSTENRLQLLAGLIDSDGHYTKGIGYEIIQKNEVLAKDIVFLCQSLGFYTSINKKNGQLKRKDGSVYNSVVYRIGIYGNVHIIPVKIERKKAKVNTPNKDNLRSNIKVESIGIGDYYGFELEGDKLFLLEDFTVTHNTTFLDDAFVLNPYEFVLSPKNTKGLKLKIFYFSMERRKNYKIAKWISRKIFTDTGRIISVNKILGWVSKENKLTDEELNIVKSYKDYINTMLNDVVTIIENPQNPMGIKKTIDAYAEANGKKVKIDDHNYKYIPNDPNEHVIVIYDHIGLQKKETRSYPNGDKVRLSSKKEIIDQSSEDARKFRDIYGYTIVKISQFNRDISNPIRLKNGDVEPMLEDFKDSSSTQEDSEICIALFDPMRYKIPDPIGYNLEKLRNQNGNKMYRSIKILKNSYGSDDVRIGLAFNPVVGIFKEMPKVQDTTEETYKAIIDNSYFTQRKLTPLKELL